MTIFVSSLLVLGVVCIFLYLISSKSASHSSSDPLLRQFQRKYLIVYLLAAAGDWLQGPHVYALYDSYGLSTHEIEMLFVAGFGSSLLFGTVVGSVADQYGRRANCALYGILYGLACVTKHFASFNILLIGRLLGGIATSILFSAFESWLVHEFNKNGFEESSLSTTFSFAVLGNSIVAILAGFAAQVAADTFGFVAPFDVSLVVLLVMCVIVVSTWSENYGSTTLNVSQSFHKALTSIRLDRRILFLGIIQSLFEGSMYMFVLEWTPTLSPHPSPPTLSPPGDGPLSPNGHTLHPRALSSNPGAAASGGEDPMVDGHRGSIPHGYIFSSFMIAIMIGSSLFRILTRFYSIESFMRPVFVVSAIALSMPVLFPGVC